MLTGKRSEETLLPVFVCTCRVQRSPRGIDQTIQGQICGQRAMTTVLTTISDHSSFRRLQVSLLLRLGMVNYMVDDVIGD